MKTPYDILEVTTDANDDEVKQAYLAKVKKFPPDHYHQQFQEIQEAYQRIKDQKRRINDALFYYPEPDFDALLDQAFTGGKPSVVTPDLFEQLLQVSIDNSIFKVPGQ